jgi:aerobic-type carbon monoxide dehydrogenase small subunit (CoxS/CutS family)
MITLKLNGQDHPLDVSEDMPLPWAIRDLAGCNGTRFACVMGLGSAVLGEISFKGGKVQQDKFRNLPARFQLSGWNKGVA